LQDREGFTQIVGIDVGALHDRSVAEPRHRHEADLALTERVHEQPATEKARREVAFEILAEFGARTLDNGRAESDTRPSCCVALEAQDREALLVDA